MATNTAASFTNHTAPGSGDTSGPYSISFSYLDEDEVDVTVGGVLKTKTTHYTFPSATTISFTSGNHPANGVSIKFQRNTDISAKKVDFQDGSVLTEADLDNNSDQILYGLQEHLDTTLNDLVYRDGSKTFTGNLVFEGATDDAHETTLAITDPTADRTITLPNTTGTVVTTGDTGTVTSTMINDGTIATADLADNSVTMAKLNSGTLPSDVVVNADNLAANSVGSSELADDAVDTAAIQDNAVTMAKLNSGALPTDITVASANIVDGTIVTGDIATGTLDNRYYTETELDAGQLDNRYYTETEADARFYNLASTEEIQSGETWVAADNKVATTSAIDNRIVDLVDDVGGFVPLVSEATFPAANPDVNNGAGTIVSVGVLSTSYTPSGGTVTIPDGTLTNISGSNVTITDCGSTVLASGHGVLVETTTTLHTYKFHRLTPKATEVTTVAGNTTNINTVAGNNTNINTVAGINANITTVAGISSNVTSVAGKATEIGRLGTADAVADMAILGTTDVVADLNTLGTADVVSDMNTLAVSGVISDMDTCATNVSNINTVGGAITNVNNVGGSIANVNTVAGNLSGVNDFGQRYRAATNNSGEYSSNNDVGDLYFNTDINAIKVWNGSAWVAGVTDTGDYAVTTGSTFTGNLKLNDDVELRLGTGDDLRIYHSGGNNYIDGNSTAEDHLYIRANVGTDHSSNIHLQAKSGEESIVCRDDEQVELYYDGSLQCKTASYGLDFADNKRADFGDSSDLIIYHDGTYNWIDAVNNHGTVLRAGTGVLYLQGSEIHMGDEGGNEVHIKTIDDGAVELYYDNVKHFETYADGAKVHKYFVVRGLEAGDSRIYMTADEGDDNADWWLMTADTSGVWTLKNLASGSYETNIECNGDGNVELYYDNSKKLETNAGGIIVGGDVDNSTSTQGVAIQTGGKIRSRVADTSATAFVVSIEDSGASKVIINGAGNGYFVGGLDVPDSAKIQLGDGDDLQIWHDGSHSIIKNGTGFLALASDSFVLENNARDENLIVGAANGAVSLNYDNSKKFETTSYGSAHTGIMRFENSGDGISFYDSRELKIGSGDDLKLYHDGTDSWIKSSTGNLNITATSTESGIIIKPNADVEIYYNDTKKLETASGGVRILGNLLLDADSRYIKLGAADDLQIHHDGSKSYIVNSTGNLEIQNGSNSIDLKANGFTVKNGADNETMLTATADGAVELYYDNVKKLNTSSGGVAITGELSVTSDVHFNSATNAAKDVYWDESASQLQFSDNVYATFGTSEDLKLYHASGNSYIENITGDLIINGNTIRLKDSGNNETLFKAVKDDSVELYFDNAVKFNSSSSGATCHGTLAASFNSDSSEYGINFAGAGTSSNTFNAAKFVVNATGGTYGSITYTTSGTTYATSSDYRLKENEVAISDGITRLKTLKPYRFNFKTDSSKTVDGFFAHEVTAVPEAVIGEKDAAEMQQIDQSKLVPLLTAALQEAITKIETLETKVAALESA